MTVLTMSQENGDGYFQVVKKIPKAHERQIARVEYVRDPITREISLVTCAQDSIKIWKVGSEDGTSLQKAQEIKGWRCGVQAFAITPDGSKAAVVGVDSTLHQMTICHERNITKMCSFNNGCMRIWHVLFAPDEQHYLTVDFSVGLTLLNMDGEVTETGSFNNVRQISVIAYSADGSGIAVANNEGVVTILTAASLTSRFFFEAHAVKIGAMCFSPDSTCLLTGSDDKTIKLHQIDSTKSQLVKSFCGHRSSVTAVRFDNCSDGQRFASCSNDALVIVWDVASGCPLHIFAGSHDGVIKDVTYSPDNQHLVSVGEDRVICVHRVDDGQRRPPPEESHSQSQDLFPESTALLESEEVVQQEGGYQASFGESYVIAKQEKEADHSNEYDPAEQYPGTVGTAFASHYHPTGLNSQEDEDVENELMARARRDIEDVSTAPQITQDQ